MRDHSWIVVRAKDPMSATMRRRVVVVFCGFCATLLTTCLSIAAFAQALPRTSPESAGLSSERLNRITELFQHDVDQGELPGVVVAIARGGKLVYEQAIGFRNREDKTPMKTDAIFRIASMSKPITSVAVMMLVEEGKIDLAAPVSQYLPEFKDLKVGLDGQPSKRPMTVQDLLRHTSGLTYGPFTDDPAIQKAYADADVSPFNFDQTNAEVITKLSKVPLAHQPGSTWDYSMSTDVLGRIVEVNSGMGLDEFVQARIVKPLNLIATGFSVSQSRAGSIAEAQADPATGKRPTMIVDNLTIAPKWFSGGGGMVSTADDYVRFCQMLLNGGELDGVRLLSPTTVALMTSDHLPPGIGYNSPFIAAIQDQAPTAEMGEGFGLGFLVRTQQGHNPLPGSVGDFSWSGYHGTYFWVDPKEKLVAVLMVQIPGSEFMKSRHYRHEMRYLVYQAITGPAEAPRIQ
jgi:CubicO group peptidase (beta-lactamase class C family)